MSRPLDSNEVDAIEARAKAATPGPWEWWTSNSWRRLKQGSERHRSLSILEPITAVDGQTDISVREEDMTFIAAARADVPALVAHIRTLEKEAVEYRRRIFGFERGMTPEAWLKLYRANQFPDTLDVRFIAHEAMFLEE